MSYPIQTYDQNTTITTIVDGALDQTHTTLNLPGPNYVGYGGILDENLVWLLENFAGNTAPTRPSLQGQLWFDKVNQTLKVFTNQGQYFSVGGTTAVSATAPSLIRTGDNWLNTTTNQLFVYDGSAYQLAGPNYTKAQGISGAIPVQVSDGANTHNILELKYGTNNTEIYAIVSADAAFTPSISITGFTQINPGITFNSNILATINSDIVGNLTGNVAGSLIGDAVVATNLYGKLTGDVTSLYILTSNFSTGNAQITGGSTTGMTSGSYATLQGTNFSTGNAQITGGSITEVLSGTFTTLQGTNFSTGNAQITGGNATGITNISAASAVLTNAITTTLVTANLSTANAQITGGNITGIANTSATTARFTNVLSSNARITGGAITGVSDVSGFTGLFNNLSTGNLLITGGNVSGVIGYNNAFSSASLINSTATTKVETDNSTAIATTAFVQSVIPAGVILMWGGSTIGIPAGWQLCDGSNGTPDLRNQFIVGAGNAYGVGTTGGATTANLSISNIPSHNHTVSVSGNTSSAGGHTHTASTTAADSGHSHSTSFHRTSKSNNATPYMLSDPTYGENINGTVSIPTTSSQAVITATTSLSTASDHQHIVALAGSTSSIGAGAAFNILPPYYALCYIQKMY